MMQNALCHKTCLTAVGPAPEVISQFARLISERMPLRVEVHSRQVPLAEQPLLFEEEGEEDVTPAQLEIFWWGDLPSAETDDDRYRNSVDDDDDDSGRAPRGISLIRFYEKQMAALASDRELAEYVAASFARTIQAEPETRQDR